jgi:glycosyltransferase involved in cell wall biosynthesis
MELLYFTDISQLDYVVATAPALLTQTRPATGDFTVSYELQRLGIDFIDEWDFLGSDDIEKNWETAHLLSRTWWDEQLASTEYAGFSLTDAAQQDMVYSFEACLNARTAYERIFSSYSVAKISGYFLPSVAVVRTGPPPTGRAVRSVVQSVLFYIAEKHGIHVVELHSGRPLSLGRIAFGKLPLSTKKAAKCVKPGHSADKIVLIYEDLMPPSESAALTEALDKLPGVKTISISQRALEVGSQIKSSGSGVESRLQSFWNRFIESFRNYSGDYPEIFANPHLLFQFERIRNGMETAADYGAMFAVFLELLKPSLVVFGHEAFTIERVLVRLARDRNIPTVGLLHSGVAPRKGYRGSVGDAAVFLVWNESDIETLISYGVDKSRLYKVGCLRYGNCYIEYTSNPGSDSSKTKRTAKGRLLLSPDKPLIVLLTAEINTGFAAPVAYPAKHRDAIRGFLSLVASRPDLQFLIKAHPGFDYYELYRRLLDPKLPNLAFLEQVPLNEILDACDICLMINYCTTAALEAMLKRVPVVYLENAVYRLHDWQDNLLPTGIHRVHSIPELERSIDSLLFNPAAKEHALAEADEQIKQILDVNEVPATSRLFEFIEHAIHDRQTGNADVFINAQGMRNMLFSHDAGEDLLSTYFNATTIKHSSGHLMCAFAYLSGINNLGLASLSRIFDVFQNHLENETVATWHKARWFLLPAYISGNINNSMCVDSKLSTIRLLSPYLLYPHKLISAPALLKRYVIMYLIQITLGRSDRLLKACWMLKRFFINVACRFGMGKDRVPRSGSRWSS